MRLAILVATLWLPVGVTVSPANGHLGWYDGQTSQVWTANADGTHVHPVGPPWRAGIGQIAWTSHGLLVDSNFTLFLLTPSGVRVKIGIVGDEIFSTNGVKAASGSAACGGCTGPVTVYNVRTHTSVRLGNRQQANEDPALSPDGSRVAYSADGALVVQSTRGGPQRKLGVNGGCTSWSPNGRTLAFYHLNLLETISPAGGRATVILRKAVCGMAAVWSPDSQTVALIYGPSRLALVNVRTHAVRKTPIVEGRVSSVTWSPDGTSLIASIRRNQGTCANIVRLDASTLAPTRLFRGCP